MFKLSPMCKLLLACLKQRDSWRLVQNTEESSFIVVEHIPTETRWYFFKSGRFMPSAGSADEYFGWFERWLIRRRAAWMKIFRDTRINRNIRLHEDFSKRLLGEK